MRIFTYFLSAIGAALFGGLLLLTLVNPIAIESGARSLIAGEIERRIDQRIDRSMIARSAALQGAS